MAAEAENLIDVSDELETSDAKKLGGIARYKKLKKLFEKRRDANHLVVIQGTPDPDAISSALALQFLGKDYGIDTTILCFTNVSHHENKALIKRLDIKLTIYNPDMDLSSFEIYSIVDSQQSITPLDSRLKETGAELFAFVDHHKEETAAPNALFVDVRQQVGSTAAIFTEYLQYAYPDGLAPGEPENVRLATALIHGIRSDTRSFALATKADFDAASYLSACCDKNVIQDIERRVFSPTILDMFENALVNRKVHDNFIFSDVGFVRSADRDGIPQVTELLLDREGTDTVLVFGIVDEKIIDGSFRTRSEIINPDEFIKGFLGASAESGKYYGGGNVQDRGGFQIPLGFFSLHEDKNALYSMARQVIEQSFLDYLGKTGKKIKTN